ncbi:MAG: rRNA pseudouridine synthase [Verrucomicrobiota bacterium]|nr:rRNA pseudouridine synthase [Verrucomicrobiota bacterium]
MKNNLPETLVNMRLNRFLAAAGLGSRRECEEIIRAGKVTVNGQVCLDLSTRVSPDDAVKANGKLLHVAQPLHVLLCKPRGYVCTQGDPHAAKTVFDLLPKNWPRLFHVGRLDKDSEGLLILTNDGEMALKLTHPRYKIEKEYEVALDRPFDFEQATKLHRGIRIEGGLAKAERVFRISAKRLKLVLRQGLKRQIRLMFSSLGYEVIGLIRTRIGTIKIGEMRPGEWRFLSSREVSALQTPSDASPRR